MRDLYSSLLALRFAATGSGSVIARRLFADYVVELAPYGRWTGASEVSFYVKSKRFSAVMNRLFRGSEFPFRSYLERKLRQDESGTLAMVMASVEHAGPSFSFMSANIYVALERLATLLDDMSSPQGAYEVLYESEMAGFLALIEGPWVYLYLAAERGLKAPEILADLAANPKLSRHTRQWRLERPLDAGAIAEFLKEFAAVTATRHTHIATTE